MRTAKMTFGQNSFFLILALLFSAVVNAQQANDEKRLKKEANAYMNEAEEALSENDFASAEAAYRKAIAKDPANTAAKYNMGNLYYNREKSGESQSRFVEADKVSESKEDRHRINHNLGNSFMKQKKYKEAVEAYKNALRNDPTDDETRYNLALAKKKLEEEQQQDQNNDDNQDNQDNKDQNEDQKDQDQDNEGDKGEDKDQDGKPEDEGDNEKQDPKDGEGDQENKKPQDQNPNEQNKEDQNQKDQKGKPDQQKQQQPQPAQGQLSPQQIKNLLEAMNNQEEKTQDKMNAEKAKAVKTRSDKDW
ncbi:tetratricopeptide repeat protein [Zunongwangia sp. SCSIO 43204]|uniref:tetratricopeptide repeat protein n=1 Tax=Zunongwangia sp. SCSIO 43204 TaxID=2779359 RepID=UPI001CA8E2D4|nr:tetratricopeptide repeat protein [Zunongwangia sp. SCSIO 43204]UAB85124.1 tetratricopeptide repeat protein [Zunongwangia sp. SCSIO 43204]